MKSFAFETNVWKLYFNAQLFRNNIKVIVGYWGWGWGSIFGEIDQKIWVGIITFEVVDPVWEILDLPLKVMFFSERILFLQVPGQVKKGPF